MIIKISKKIESGLYALFRFIIGLLFAFHGMQKFGLFGGLTMAKFAAAFSIPIWLATVVAIVEFAGGIAIALGLLTRLALVGTAVDMITALFMAHFPKGWNPLLTGAELPLLYLISFILIFAYGSGHFSLDRLLIGKDII